MTTAESSSPVSKEDLQSLILRLIATPPGGPQATLLHALPKTVKHALGPVEQHDFGGPWSSARTSDTQIYEALWDLLSRGLVYIEMPFSDGAEPFRLPLGNCIWRLTAAGRVAAGDQDTNPDDAPAYLRRLRATAPELTPAVERYVTEALRAYEAQCYLASAVMLGVAAEAAFDSLLEAFVAWLPREDANRFRKKIERAHYARRLEEFRDRLREQETALPPELRDGMRIKLDGLLELLRVTRNDVGHPTGKGVDRDTQRTHLALFVLNVGRLYALRRFFTEAANPEPRAAPVQQ